MATTPYGTPMVSSVMPNPTSAVTQLMGTNSPMANTANMGLPFSSNLPIDVNENTSNLEEIQNFPVVGRTPNGIHFHQDPITGQMYRMKDQFHQKIPEILINRNATVVSPININQISSNVTNLSTTNQNILNESYEINYSSKRIPVNTSIFLESLDQNKDYYYDESYFKDTQRPLIQENENLQTGDNLQLSNIVLNNNMTPDKNSSNNERKMSKIVSLVGPQDITLPINNKPIISKISKISNLVNSQISTTSPSIQNEKKIKMTRISNFI